MRKFVGTVQRLMKSFSISVAFGIGVFAYPIDTKPIGKTEKTMQNRYAETNVRLYKIENAGYNVVSIWVCKFKKLSRENPGLQNELCSHTYVKKL